MKLWTWIDPASRHVCVTIIDERGPAEMGYEYVAKPVELVFEKIEEGTRIEPTFRFPRLIGQEFIKQMAEEADRLGVKTDQDAVV